jgi:RNA polymerase primary sigma factor
MRLIDVVVGFVDPNAPDEIAQPQNPTKMMARSSAKKERRRRGGRRQDEEAIDTGPDPEEAAQAHRLDRKMLHHQFLNALDKLGSKDPKTQKMRKKLCGEFMELKLSPRCSIS